MKKIHVLPDTLINQIAAGEVVERPASVVKELIENSLDAGASHIAIEVELGGRRLIRVSDDGNGMGEEDAVAAFERHATSKLSRAEDLSSIGTLGFRGEALASIASVSKVELITRPGEAELGCRVVIEGGHLAEVTPAGRAAGTTIVIRELFFNTPARRKFMRSEATENFHISSIVTNYALARPETSFLLASNGREILRVSPAKDIRERTYQILGKTALESLIPIHGGNPSVCQITGFTSAPRERRTSRDSQFFFVNGRFVKDKVLASALSEGYRGVLPHGSYPVSIVFVETPLDEVDVNVHPAKTEVRFRRGDAVRETLSSAIRASLHSGGIKTAPEIFAPANSRAPSAEPRNDGASPILSGMTRESSDELSFPGVDTDESNAESRNGIGTSGELIDEREKPDIAEIVGREATEHHFPDVGSSEPIGNVSAPSSYKWMSPVDSASKLVRKADVDDVSKETIRPIAQLHNSFIIAVDRDGLLLIDQHVAHERILFDLFRRREASARVPTQRLLVPLTFDLTPAQSEVFDELCGELEAMGMEVDRLSGRSVVIRAIPGDLNATDCENLLREILDTVDPLERRNPELTLRDELAASMACKAAVKINMPLTIEKMAWMIDRLLVTTSPTTCPHGRPVILRLTMDDIARGFHRS